MMTDLPQYVTYEKGDFRLFDDYLMAFRHFDGFSWRHLRIELLITRDLALILHYKAFRFNKTTGDFHFLTQTNGLPDLILNFLASLTTKTAKQLLYPNRFPPYEGAASVIDQASQQYLFNIDGVTKTVDIEEGGTLSDELFVSDIEKKFLTMHRFIMEWAFKFYDQYEQLCAFTEKPAK